MLEPIDMFKITTVTAVAHINGGTVDLDAAFDRIVVVEGNDPVDDPFHIVYSELVKDGNPNLSKGHQPTRKKPRRRFGRTTYLALELDGRVHVKIFTSGKIQIVGAKAISDGEKVARYIATRIVRRQASCVDGFSVLMINATFDTERRLCRHALHDTVVDIAKHSKALTSAFDPSQWPGVKLYFEADDRRIFAGVFGSGKVIVTGATTVEQIGVVQKQILSLVNENHQTIVCCEKNAPDVSACG
jgi:hypothetical protein